MCSTLAKESLEAGDSRRDGQAVHDALAELAVGDELEVLVDPFPAIVPDLQASPTGCWRDPGDVNDRA
ncbi:MAG: hypothetical protein ACXVE1_16260, partial [Gaiellaceae bacterium]